MAAMKWLRPLLLVAAACGRSSPFDVPTEASAATSSSSSGGSSSGCAVIPDCQSDAGPNSCSGTATIKGAEGLTPTLVRAGPWITEGNRSEGTLAIRLVSYGPGLAAGACGEPGPFTREPPPAIFIDVVVGDGPVVAGTYPFVADGTNPDRPPDGGPFAALQWQGIPMAAAVSGSVTLTEVCGTVTGTFDAVLGSTMAPISGSFSAPYCGSGT
jgi:hypothetical protein